MTAIDMDRFGASYRRMAAALAPGKAITVEQVADAFEDCRQHPIEVVERALERLRVSRRFVPKPTDLIGACNDQARERATSGGSVPPWVDPVAGRYYCEICEDTGFEAGLQCAGDGACHAGSCGRAGQSGVSHSYTRRCRCRASNPVLATDRGRMRRPTEGDRA